MVLAIDGPWSAALNLAGLIPRLDSVATVIDGPAEVWPLPPDGLVFPPLCCGVSPISRATATDDPTRPAATILPSGCTATARTSEPPLPPACHSTFPSLPKEGSKAPFDPSNRARRNSFLLALSVAKPPSTILPSGCNASPRASAPGALPPPRRDTRTPPLANPGSKVPFKPFRPAATRREPGWSDPLAEPPSTILPLGSTARPNAPAPCPSSLANGESKNIPPELSELSMPPTLESRATITAP